MTNDQVKMTNDQVKRLLEKLNAIEEKLSEKFKAETSALKLSDSVIALYVNFVDAQGDENKFSIPSVYNEEFESCLVESGFNREKAMHALVDKFYNSVLQCIEEFK